MSIMDATPTMERTYGRKSKVRAPLNLPKKCQNMGRNWSHTMLSCRTNETYYDHKQETSRDYKPGDKVWLEGYNITTDRPSRNSMTSDMDLSKYSRKLAKPLTS